MLFWYFLGGFKNTFTKVSKSTEVQKKDKTEKSEPTAGEFKLVFFDCELVWQSFFVVVYFFIFLTEEILYSISAVSDQGS